MPSPPSLCESLLEPGDLVLVSTPWDQSSGDSYSTSLSHAFAPLCSFCDSDSGCFVLLLQ